MMLPSRQELSRRMEASRKAYEEEVRTLAEIKELVRVIETFGLRRAKELNEREDVWDAARRKRHDDYLWIMQELYDIEWNYHDPADYADTTTYININDVYNKYKHDKEIDECYEKYSGKF